MWLPDWHRWVFPSIEPEYGQVGSLRTIAEKNGSTVVRSTFQLYDAVGRLRMRAVTEGALQYL
jgi:hypothetical protein